MSMGQWQSAGGRQKGSEAVQTLCRILRVKQGWGEGAAGASARNLTLNIVLGFFSFSHCCNNSRQKQFMEGRVILAHSLKVHRGREGRAAGTQGLWSDRIASASESKQGDYPWDDATHVNGGSCLFP